MDNLMTLRSENTITTLEIAEMMKVPHSDVLKKIEGRKDRKGYVQIISEGQMSVADYFIESEYQDAQGKPRKCYKVTKLGCDFLANKFTGEKGIIFTARYVKRFDEMENEQRPKSSAEMLLIYAQQFYEQEQRISNIKNNIKELEAKVTTHNDDYYTVAGYASLRGLNIDVNKASMLGRKASKLSKEYGYDVSKTKDPRFGSVNLYHVDILKEVFKEQLIKDN